MWVFIKGGICMYVVDDQLLFGADLGLGGVLRRFA